MADYEWNQNCAVVDRLYYWEYFLRGTTAAALTLTVKDLWFIRSNWYASRAYKRLPVVSFLLNYILVLGSMGWNKPSIRLVLSLSFNSRGKKKALVKETSSRKIQLLFDFLRYRSGQKGMGC